MLTANGAAMLILSVRGHVYRLLAYLLDEPVPFLAEPYPPDGPVPGAYEIRLSDDGVTMWYVVTPYEGYEVIAVMYVWAD